MHKLIKVNISKFKLWLIIFFIIYAVDIVLSLIEPVIFGEILDTILGNTNIINAVLIKKILLLCAVIINTFVLTFIYRRIIFSIGRKVKQGVLSDLLYNFEARNVSFFENIDKGKFVSYITNDIDHLWSILSHGTIEITRVILFTIMGYIISINYVNFLLSSSVFVIFPIFLYIIVKLNYTSQKVIKEKKDLEANISKIINDGFVGFSVIKSYVNESETINKFDAVNSSIKEKDIEYNKSIAIIDFISVIFKGLSFSIACIYGIYLVTENVITIGSFIAFNSIIQKVLSDYVYTGNLVKKVNEIRIINKRLDFLYDMDLNRDGDLCMPQNPNIEIKNLTFKYKNDQDTILENINLSVPYGSFIGIMGKTGSGKTTLVNILAKFYEIDYGIVLFNGIDINNIKRNEFYKDVSYAMQDDYVYDNTIKYNVELGKEYDINEVNDALQEACFLKTINEFSQKYETYIGDSGVKISGGQKQRLILSRNVLKKHKILIIDNALSGLDSKTRKKVINNITQKSKITLILISDTFDDFKGADKIYLLENKQLKEVENCEV